MRTKRIGLLLSLFTIGITLLAACSGGSQNTPTPTPVAAVTQGLPNTGSTAAATAIGTEMMGGGSSGTQPAASETPGAASGGGGTATAVAGAGAGLPIGMADPSLLSNLMALQVRNINGDTLGVVNNAVFDLNSFKVRYLIVTSGGFLGIGQKLIPVPWALFSLDPTCQTVLGMSGSSATVDTSGSGAGAYGTGSGITTTETSGAGMSSTPGVGMSSTSVAGAGGTAAPTNCYLLVNVSTDNILKNAPTISSSVLNNLTPGWDATYSAYWAAQAPSGAGANGTGGTGTEVPGSGMMTETPAAGGASSTMTPGGTLDVLSSNLLGMSVIAGTNVNTTGSGAGMSSTETSGAGMAATETPPGSGMTGTETSGASSTIMPGQTIGSISDLILNLDSGNLTYVVIAGNGSAGLNSNLFPVPPQLFTFDTTAKTATFNQATSVLISAPNFSPGQLPNTSASGWDAQLKSYWQGFMGAGTGSGAGGGMSTETPVPGGMSPTETPAMGTGGGMSSSETPGAGMSASATP